MHRSILQLYSEHREFRVLIEGIQDPLIEPGGDRHSIRHSTTFLLRKGFSEGGVSHHAL
jgi:hypothetical protein